MGDHSLVHRSGMADEQTYLLGHDEREWSRLQAQHVLWRDTILSTLEPLLRGNETILEVGCGSGALLADLALRVPGGRIVGVERDGLAAARARAAVPRATVLEGDLRTLALPSGNDVVVARWVFSFLSDPREALERLASVVSSGGFIVVQDYNHEGFGLWPSTDSFSRVVPALREAYADTGGDLWVAARLPAIAAGLGFEVVSVEAHVKSGLVRTPTWSWIESFLLDHVPTLVETGHLTEDELARFREDWAMTRATPGATLFSPIIATIVLRVP